MNQYVTQDDIDTYQRDGVVLIKALFADQADTLRAGIDRNMADSEPFGAENTKTGKSFRFFDDYCNWTRIAVFEEAIRTSPAVEIAADLMGSKHVQMFHEHVLVKEPGRTSPPFTCAQSCPRQHLAHLKHLKEQRDRHQGSSRRQIARGQYLKTR